jgi:ribosomal protein S3AE
MTNEVGKVQLRELVKELVSELIDKEIEKQTRNISPLKDAMIRKQKVHTVMISTQHAEPRSWRR